MYLFANYICYQFSAIPYLIVNNWVKQESVGRPIFCIVKCKSLIHLIIKGLHHEEEFAVKKYLIAATLIVFASGGAIAAPSGTFKQAHEYGFGDKSSLDPAHAAVSCRLRKS
jgi:hypothetical protein